MIAATYVQGGPFSVEDIPRPSIGRDEILLRVRASSICGTDVRIIRNGHRKLRPGQKIVLGHEFAGTIEEAGKDVTGYSPGVRVGVVPNMGCGRCDMCARGLANMCPDYVAFGITMDGCHAEYVRLPASTVQQGNVVPLPDSLSWIEASLIEPFSCVVNGQRAVRIAPGDSVVIFGAGPIGLMHLLLARNTGASQVILIDPDERRLTRGRELGASAVVSAPGDTARTAVMDLTNGRGADVAITACASREAPEVAQDMLAPFGRLCLFGGLPADDARIPLNVNKVHYCNLVITGTTGGPPLDFRRAMRLIAGGTVDLKPLVSNVFVRSRMSEAFETAMNGQSLKVVITGEP